MLTTREIEAALEATSPAPAPAEPEPESERFTPSSAALARRLADTTAPRARAQAPVSAADLRVARALSRAAGERALQREGDDAAATATPVATALKDTLAQLLGVYGPIDVNAALTAIHAAPLDQRRAALLDDTVQQLARARLTPELRTVLNAAMLEGAQKWVNPPRNDFFDFFVTNRGAGPLPAIASMNCWETILYSAYLAGALTVDWIVDFYRNALAAPDPNVLIWQQLGWVATLPTVPPAAPSAGQLLFYIDGGAPYPGHVALAIGGDQAISLWNQPHSVDTVQRIRIGDLAGTVHVATAPW